MRRPDRAQLLILTGLAALAVVAYLPVLTQPFIADDYGNILLARMYGSVSGWSALAADAAQRSRPLLLILTYWIDHLFGPWAPAFYVVSVILHVLNTWLVFGLGVWKTIGWRVSAVAAAFFAVYEGHQEAVMWYSAAYELLLALFGLSCLILWILWLQSERRRALYYAGALLCFVLALASKESGVVIVALLVLVLIGERRYLRRGLLGAAPFAALAFLWSLAIFGLGSHHPRLDDGSFSLRAPAALTWLNSYWRLLWIWGLISLAAVGLWRARQWRSLIVAAALWMGIALAPYSFLTYMTRVPSRQTYLASVGLSWIVAAGFLTAWEHFRLRRQWVVAVIAAVVVIHNVGYLWTKKRAQYQERAAATEALVQLARTTSGPVYVHRFPYPLIVAQGAMVLRAGKPADAVVWAPEGGKSSSLMDFAFSLDERHPVTGTVR